MGSLKDNYLFVTRRTTLITQLRLRLFSLCIGTYNTSSFHGHFFVMPLNPVHFESNLESPKP